LAFSDVPDGRLNMFLDPEVPRTSVSGPTFTIHRIALRFVQPATGVRLEVIHHSLGRGVSGNDDVQMIGSDMSREQSPAAVRTHFLNGTQYGGSPGLV
jgi:hypothetical protein